MKIPCSVCRIHGIPQIDLWERRKFKVKKVICLSCRCPHRRHQVCISIEYYHGDLEVKIGFVIPVTSIHRSIVREHGGVNCPHSVPANQREYIATQIHAAHIHYLCPGGKPCPDFFKKKKKRSTHHSGHIVLKFYFALFFTEANLVGLIRPAFCLYC